MFTSVTEGRGKGLNLFTVCDLSERGNTCLDHTESPVLSFLQIERKGQQKQTKQHKATQRWRFVFCFVLTACESGRLLFTKVGEKMLYIFTNSVFFPLYCQGRKIAFLSAKESIKGTSSINKPEGNVRKQQKSKQLSISLESEIVLLHKSAQVHSTWLLVQYGYAKCPCLVPFTNSNVRLNI